LFSQILCRCRKAIGDRDPNLRINFGYIDGQAVEFDLGSYYSKPELSSPFLAGRELFFTTYKLQKWLENHSPDLLNYFLESLANTILNEVLTYK
jgi:hypothetical protein